MIEEYVRDNYDLTPQGIIKYLHLLSVDYNKVSAYGHFGKKDLPWERCQETDDDQCIWCK
jgi:S-adenosylmethionine synthetase